MLAADPDAIEVNGPVLVWVSRVCVVICEDPELVANVRSTKPAPCVNVAIRAVANTPTTIDPAGATTAGAVNVDPLARTTPAWASTGLTGSIPP